MDAMKQDSGTSAMVGGIRDVVTAAVVIGAAEGKISPMLTPKTQTVKPVETPKSDQSQQTQEVTEQHEQAAIRITLQDGEEKEYFPQDDSDFHIAPGTMTEEAVSRMTEELNELMSRINCNLEFSYNKEAGMMSVKMVNKETQEVIKELPPEEMLENIVKAKDWLGAFIDENA